MRIGEAEQVNATNVPARFETPVNTQDKAQRFGKCLVEREIGRGARATVYLAWHEGFQIPVAVKVITQENALGDDHFAERFMREARIAAQLNHSSIVRVYDCGENEAGYYLVMEYVEGESCKEKMEQWGAFDWQRALQIIGQVAEGLQYANRKGIIHRDIKPENIMIGSDGDARLTDLGLAKQVVQGRGSATADGDVLGTPYYMSPEQVRQPSSVDFRSDIYSLGATLYHMATGEVPFEAATPYEIMTMHLSAPLVPPEQRKPDLPPALCRLIIKAMAKEPEDRHRDYNELLANIDAVLEGTDIVASSARPNATDSAEDMMGPVEASIEDSGDSAGETARAPAPQKSPARVVRPVRPVELPITPQNVTTRLLGLLAVLLLVSNWVCIYLFTAAGAGALVGLVVLAPVVAACIGWGWHCSQTHRKAPADHESLLVDELVSSALATFCERLDLPAPRIRLTRADLGPCYAYSMFARKASLHVPASWIRRGRLTDDEREALLAHALCGVYTGDSDIRAVLAAPTGVLRTGHRAACLLRRFTDGFTPSGARKASLMMGVLTLVLACGLTALLYVISLGAGVVGTAFLLTILATAAFERHSQLAGDVFATALTSPEAVRSTAIAMGLSRPESYRLLADSVDEETAEKWGGALPPAIQRERLNDDVVGHFSEVEYLPEMAEIACKLFATVPFAADRLNRLAGIPSRPSATVATVNALKKFYIGLLGTPEPRPTCMIDLAKTASSSLVGAAGGLLAVAVMWLLALGGGAQYATFVIVFSLAGLAMGLVITPLTGQFGSRPGQMGWNMMTAGVAFCTVAMVAFCTIGGTTLSRYAIQCPVALILMLLVAYGASAVFYRLAPALGIEMTGRSEGLGGKTAHTVIMSVAEHHSATTTVEAQTGKPEETTAATEVDAEV